LLSKHHRLLEWARLFASYSFVQAIAQGLGFLAGILIVRSLKKEEYAYFLIVNTMIPMMNLLSDNGISSSLFAIGGKVWQDDQRMGSLIKTAMILRRQLVLVSFIVVTPILIWLLMHNHAPLHTVVWLVLLTLVGVFFQLNIGVLNVVLSLRQQLSRMQTLVFVSVLPRLMLIVLFIALGILNASWAIVAGCFALIVQYVLLRHWVKPQIDWHAPSDVQYRKDTIAIVKQQAPQIIYFCLQSQIGIWLISIFGHTHSVADLGALGRIGMIFSIFVSTTLALVAPRFARCQDATRLRTLYVLILIGFAGVLMLGVVFAWLFPAPLLWLLGAQYAKLGNLMCLSVLATATYSLAGLIYSLNVNRGWITPALIIIPAEILTQIILCLSFNLSSVYGVLMIGVFAPIIPGIINLMVGLRKLNSMRLSDTQ
jgi:O-antigen/teichoic acid export membrane protein